YGQPAVAQIGPDSQHFGAEITRLQQQNSSELRKAIAAIYTAEIGTLEIGKNNHGPGPKKYLTACGLDEGYAYCACFVKWTLATCSVPTNGGTAWSPSWFPTSKVIWKQNARLSGVEAPTSG